MLIEIKGPSIDELEIHVVSVSPLIQHAWAEKAKLMMLSKQMKKATGAKEAKDPEADYREALYPGSDDGTSPYGFPAVGIKAAMVSAGRTLDLKMTNLRQMFHINCELIPIYGNPAPREDMVRLNGSTADIRYRPEFASWASRFVITFDQNAISPEQIGSLIQHAGFAVGIGEWRPEKSGNFGRFTLSDAKAVACIRDAMDPSADPRRVAAKAA